MDVVIAGGHGKIGRRLARLLVERGDRVRGLIRNPDHADDLRADGSEPVLCDLESATADEVAAAGEAAQQVTAARAASLGRRRLVDARVGGQAERRPAARLEDAAQLLDVAERHLRVGDVLEDDVGDRAVERRVLDAGQRLAVAEQPGDVVEVLVELLRAAQHLR